MTEPASNVVPFKKRAVSNPALHPKRLLETVYSAGSIAVSADDVATKTASLMLQALGFLVIEEVLADGSARKLARGEAGRAIKRPWRLSKPAFSGAPGEPDADGAFLGSA